MNVATRSLEQIRADFPILQRRVRDNKPLVYLDNAATTQKPQSVIEALTRFYSHYNSNIHRGVHALSEAATEAYETARKKVQTFLNAAHSHEIIFTRGTTESINLVALSFGSRFLEDGDEVLLTQMEHHANIVPWQLLQRFKNIKIKVIPITEEGTLDLNALDTLLTEKTRLLAFTHVSNALGTVNPVKKLIRWAKENGLYVLVDGAQAVPHLPVDVQDLQVDFYVFSGHKIYGPTGIGVLYGKTELLEAMPPYQGGGDMIKRVTFEKTLFNDLPMKFEAGTPNIAGAIGLGAAIDYIQQVGYDFIQQQEQQLLDHATRLLSEIPEIKIIGTAKEKAAVVSFVCEGVHPHDIGTLLDLEGVAVRAGHHCAQPVMDFYGLSATVRASFAFYNTMEEVEYFVQALKKAIRFFKR